uniref:B box-type domain-containing protein n=1 Tax=Acrobeloides nanus TaxID=290746 RepID=A0A914E2H9_9BILA
MRWYLQTLDYYECVNFDQITKEDDEWHCSACSKYLCLLCDKTTEERYLLECAHCSSRCHRKCSNMNTLEVELILDGHDTYFCTESDGYYAYQDLSIIKKAYFTPPTSRNQTREATSSSPGRLQYRLANKGLSRDLKNLIEEHEIKQKVENKTHRNRLIDHFYSNKATRISSINHLTPMEKHHEALKSCTNND